MLQFDIDWDNHNEIGARQNIMNAILAGGYGEVGISRLV